MRPAVDPGTQRRLEVLQRARAAQERIAAAHALNGAEHPAAVARNGERAIALATAAGEEKPEAAAARTEPRRVITPMRVFFLVAAALIYGGWQLPTERYLTPEAGMGYAAGIAGGSAILLLLLYPARKRARWLFFIGSVKGWFQAHMVLGIVAPLFILYHSNFSLGAANSNVALFAMLIVAGSGLVGRYFYTRIHLGLYGRRASRADMAAAAVTLKAKVAGSQFMPELLARLDAAEARMLRQSPGAMRALVRPLFVTCRMHRESWRLRRYAMRELRLLAARSPVIGKQQIQLRGALRSYIARRLQATRRVAEFESYERLFSLWHVFHLPLFFMLLIAGIVHVVSVHVY